MQTYTIPARSRYGCLIGWSLWTAGLLAAILLFSEQPPPPVWALGVWVLFAALVWLGGRFQADSVHRVVWDGDTITLTTARGETTLRWSDLDHAVAGWLHDGAAGGPRPLGGRGPLRLGPAPKYLPDRLVGKGATQLHDVLLFVRDRRRPFGLVLIDRPEARAFLDDLQAKVRTINPLEYRS